MGPQPADGAAALWAERVCREHLDEVLAASEDAFFVFDRRGTCVYAYGADLPLWGHDRWACLGKTPGEIWTLPELHKPFERWFEAVLASGAHQSEEVGLDTIFGRHWFSFTLHPIGARPGGPEAVSVAVRDISERKQLAGALGAGHEPGQALNVLFGTVLHDQRRIVSVDHGLAEMLGYPVEALIGRPIDQILCPATDGGPGPRRGRAIHADGTPITIDLKDERVTIEAGTWIMTSVFNRQAHEREAWGLLDAADRWRSLIESTVQYIVVTTVTGEVTFINRTPPGFERVHVLGASLFTFMTPIVRKEKRRLMDEVLRTGGVYTHEAYFQDPVAGTTWLRTTLGPIRRGDAIVGVLWSACDVTEVRRLAETLARREREVARLRELDALKEQLIGIVAHELRTPLTAMMGYAELLGDGIAGPLSALQRQFLRQIVASTKRQTMLVDTLLDRTRLDSGLFKLSCEKVDLAAVIRETVDALMPIIEDAGLTITVGPIDPVPPMTIDARRIDEVLANLLTNAIRYVPSGGHVRVSMSRQAGGVYVEVADSGPGIPPKDQARLFQRLSQLDAGRREGMGLGLGLWICKSIIEAHGGAIGVKSRPGEGSTFWFTLPGPA